MQDPTSQKIYTSEGVLAPAGTLVAVGMGGQRFIVGTTGTVIRDTTGNNEPIPATGWGSSKKGVITNDPLKSLPAGAPEGYITGKITGVTFADLSKYSPVNFNPDSAISFVGIPSADGRLKRVVAGSPEHVAWLNTQVATGKTEPLKTVTLPPRGLPNVPGLTTDTAKQIYGILSTTTSVPAKGGYGSLAMPQQGGFGRLVFENFSPLSIQGTKSSPIPLGDGFSRFLNERLDRNFVNASVPNEKGAGLFAAGFNPRDPGVFYKIEEWGELNPQGAEQVEAFYSTFGIDKNTLTEDEKKSYALQAVDWYFRTGGNLLPATPGSAEYLRQDINGIYRETGYVPPPNGTVINGVVLGGGLGASNNAPYTQSAPLGGLIGMGFDPFDPAIVPKLQLTLLEDDFIGGEIRRKLAGFGDISTPERLVEGMNWYYADLGRRMDIDNSFFNSVVGRIVKFGITTIASAINPWVGAVAGGIIGAIEGGPLGLIEGAVGGYGIGNIVGIDLNKVIKIPIVSKFGLLPSPTADFGLDALKTLLTDPVAVGKKIGGALAKVAWDKLTADEKRQFSDFAIETGIPIVYLRNAMTGTGAGNPNPPTTQPSPRPAPGPYYSQFDKYFTNPKGLPERVNFNQILNSVKGSSPGSLDFFVKALDAAGIGATSGPKKYLFAEGGEVTSPWASDLSQISEGWQAAQNPLEDKFAKMDNKEFIQNASPPMISDAKKDYTDLMGGSPNAMAASGMNSFIKSFG